MCCPPRGLLGLARPFEDQDCTDEARNMHGGRAYLLGFVLPLKGGDQFPSLLGLLIDRVFHVHRPGTLIRVQVDDFVA
jgi:hypothetical protein